MTPRILSLRLILGLLIAAIASPTLIATAQDAAAEAETVDVYAVPEGTDANELQLYLRKLARTPPPERTPEGILAHLQKMDESFTTILDRDAVDEETYLMAAELRLQVLGLLPQFGDNTGALKRAKLIEKLQNDDRAQVKALAARIELQERIGRLPTLPDAAKKELIKELAGNLKSATMENPEELQLAIQGAMQAAQMLDRYGDTENAVFAYDTYTSILKAKNEADLGDLIETLEATARRLKLPGNEIEVAGTTLDGSKFNIDQYKGKVVLVDFWATWCGPCIGELPNVKEMYEAYHDKGFEVVGISLDNDREALVEFVKDNDLNWVTLFEEAPELQGWDNPIARYYGISGIPTVILVDQSGKVVNLNARDEVLRTELARLLGPIDDSK
ncbi:Thiol-disulfide oxidoreductase ResA [Thalassoglobus neptunius]|uniref:Thiol-disulfide oxidoreductase ResA n=1 Tax=Thalassoglobus neptunius TaxID=1938619 RepID=A0A5C5WPX0_9PLAN|nr:TlpA disulfide reductase family protein [Thalassoglobus neptunius]TWT52073.1 Thiol-disulfide oxidoreductase ResA [Thalassoglobus neptunius]